MPPQGGPQHADLTPAAMGQPPASAPPSGAKPDRREFDNRRVKARLIDLILLLPITITIRLELHQSHTFFERWQTLALIGAYVTYFFICEALWGQTIGKRQYGLRVVSTSGGAPGLNAIATRNVIRIVEEPLIAIFVMAGSRGRRQRVGDLVCSTAVVGDDGGAVPGPRGPMLALYPALWAVVGVVIFQAIGGPASPSRSGVAYAPPGGSVSPVAVGELTPEAEHYADRVNRYCRDGIHAQAIAIAEIEQAARISGAPISRARSAAYRALGSELREISRNVQFHLRRPPPQTQAAVDRWTNEISANVEFMRILSRAAESDDQPLAEETLQNYGPALAQLVQLSRDLHFDDCLVGDPTLQQPTT